MSCPMCDLWHQKIDTLEAELKQKDSEIERLKQEAKDDDLALSHANECVM